MLRKNTKPETSAPSRDSQHIDTLIGAHSTITGDMTFEGSVRIDGRFEGNIHSAKEGTLIVSEGASITGEVRVPNLVLHGTIDGNVFTSKTLKLGSTARLNGDVEYTVIAQAEGSWINGRLRHVDESMQPQGSNGQTEPENQPI